MSRFTIGIVGRDTALHAVCFEDVAKALAGALRVLDHEVTGFENPGRLIMFGANNVHDPDGKIPKDAIIFNSEQIAAQNGVSEQMSNYEQYKKMVVWDYSEANIAKMRAFGLERTVHCPIGYVPSMSCIEPAEEDIDVLWYGSVNDRRREILDALDNSGLKVKRLFGVYGAERDKVIARAKVVLNLHFYEHAVFEIFRCSHLFANSKCVVTEGGGCDETLESFARLATYYVPRDEIVNACKRLVVNSDLRRFTARRGRLLFEQIDFVKSVKKALEAS